MDDKLTYWDRLWRVAVGIPTLFIAIFIVASIGGTIGMSYVNWEWYWSAPRDIYLGIYNWFDTMSAMGWRVFVPVYVVINLIVTWYWEMIDNYFDIGKL